MSEKLKDAGFPLTCAESRFGSVGRAQAAHDLTPVDQRAKFMGNIDAGVEDAIA
jgi:hypothetical protein